MAIELKDWGWRYATRQAWAVRHLDLQIEDGERVLLVGASGSGKSTLLHALAGLLGGADEGEEEGTLLIDGVPAVEAKGRTALVMQDPESQIILSRVGDDVAFGAENMCVPRDEIWQRVADSLDVVGLDVPLDRSTVELSGGQKQRLALAGALAMGARWLLLDEPTANLDLQGSQDVRHAVEDVVDDRSTTLIVVEHHCEAWSVLMDRVIVVSPEGVIADGPPWLVFSSMGPELEAMGIWVPRLRHQQPAPILPIHPPSLAWNGSILSARDLSIGYSVPVRERITLDIQRGASTVITGPNGSGKTTLALTIAGLLPRLAGTVEVSTDLGVKGNLDPGQWKSRQLLTRIGTVFQNPEHQFVASTVEAELAGGLHALKVDKSFIDVEVARLLDLLHLTPLARANPFTLSGGEKRRLSVGTVLATNPQMIILDEPTFGQDRNTWMDLVNLIATLRDSGTTIISVTHDQEYVAALGDRVIEMESL